ncbi:MAG TPA: SufBD protein [Candidatus Limiplasma sp.]|nr:SufBD protein [Candidatus Limiplasma sp.]HPS80816.1 SufBD protein [Candidatus Limiplasma sp.]
MDTLADWVDGLEAKNNQYAYECFKRLQEACAVSGDAYAYFNRFARLMDSDSSYPRTRGLLMIAACARWDTDNRIDELLDRYLKHIEDVKPITARQCIQALPEMARYKPDLAPLITQALMRANPFRYPVTMQPLVQKDIAEALRRIYETAPAP